ncbi:MAG: hypothetical protein WAW86_07340 [Gammaproteobacteria bacterium]
MKQVLDRLVDKISQANMDPLPSDNFYMEDVFDAATYSNILKNLPRDDSYHFINHPDAVLPDGTATRMLLDLTDDTINRLHPENQHFWREMKDVFVSQALLQAVLNKFQGEITKRFGANWPEMVLVPIFYRDFPGYKIGVHTDAPFKIATMQFYFPSDESQLHLGTSFHVRKGDFFHLLKTNSFKPNSGYAFVRTDCSWHSVRQLGVNETKRDSLALTVYVKGEEYSSGKGY